MNTVKINNNDIDHIRTIMEGVGTTIGSVHFKKRSDGKLRKMAFRLHVKTPSFAKAPKGIATKEQEKLKEELKEEFVNLQYCSECGKIRGNCDIGPFRMAQYIVRKVVKSELNREDVDKANKQLTVFDVNKVVRASDGKIEGRGAWRTVPLDNVTRIVVKGTEYIIQ